MDTRCRDNVCVRVENGTDAGASSSGMASSGSSSNSGSNGGADAGGTDGGGVDAGRDAGGLGCVGADDGVLTAAELPLSLGVPLRMVASNGVDGGVPVDLVGTIAGDGVAVWDFSAALAGDSPVTIEASALEGKWFAHEFADGGYVAPLDGTGETLGIYRRDAEKVELLGVASREPETTLLKHDPPIKVLQFPITLGQSFGTQTTTSGTLEGNAFYVSSDRYDFLVDGRGRVKTPAGEFSTLRVRTEQTVQVGVFPFQFTYHWFRYAFLSSCYSTVAAISSLQDEEQPTFTRASEVRRIGLP